jgi:TIR domain
MDRRDIREKAETLQNVLIARATGGSADDPTYRSLRDELLSEFEIRDRLPAFVRTSRDLSQFWAYITKQSGQYASRREHIWEAFNGTFEYLEAPSAAEPTEKSPQKGDAPVPIAEQIRPRTREKVRVFISYSTHDKSAAGAVKHAISSAGFECFLAHEDLQVSEEWRERILEELDRCEILVVILSKSFIASSWAPQEIGVIVGRRSVPIVPLSLDGTIPFGFISHIQGRPIPPGGIQLGTILEPLAKKYPRLAVPALIQRVREASSYRSAEAALQPLVPVYQLLTDGELEDLVDAANENGQVWNAALCYREYLPALIRTSRDRIPRRKLKALEYQVRNQSWFNEDEA